MEFPLNRTNNYSSFLLRFRLAQNNDQPTWVVCLQNTHSGQQTYFSSLDGLFQFLQAEFGSSDNRTMNAGEFREIENPTPELRS
jgi:hypothetical protein